MAQILRPPSHYEGNYWRSDCFGCDKNSPVGNNVELIRVGLKWRLPNGSSPAHPPFTLRSVGKYHLGGWLIVPLIFPARTNLIYIKYWDGVLSEESRTFCRLDYVQSETRARKIYYYSTYLKLEVHQNF